MYKVHGIILIVMAVSGFLSAETLVLSAVSGVGGGKIGWSVSAPGTPPSVTMPLR